MPREWTAFSFPEFRARSTPIMVTLNNDSILILGGWGYDLLSDGVVFDSETRQVKTTISKSTIPFYGMCNQHYVTNDGKVVALVCTGAIKSSLHMIEVSADGQQVTLHKKFERGNDF